MSSYPFTFTEDGSLPGLYIPHPQCDHCLQDVDIEDGYASCPRCLVQWDEISEDADAEPDPNIEGTEVLCEIVTEKNPYLPDDYVRDGKRFQRGPLQPCILPSGHEGGHLCPVEVTVSVVAEAGQEATA